jgi:hypothetical protein
MKREERTQVDPNREGSSIVVTNFNGLNTTSNPMTIPYEDSPIFTNVIVGERGGVERRPGTQVVYEPVNSKGSVLIPVSTSYGYNYILTKDGTSLVVLEYSNDRMTTVLSKVNVWSQAASEVEPSYVTLPEPGSSTVLLCTGNNAPIQCRFEEFRTSVTFNSPSTLITISDDAKISGHLATNTLLYVNGVPRTVNTKTSSNGLTTFSIAGAPIPVGTYVIDLVFVTWQWWAESFYYYGDRFYDTVNRSHAKVTDVHVAIPENIRDDLEPLLPNFPLLYPIDALYWNGSQQVYCTPISNLKPTTAYQYTFSDGSQRLDVNAPATFSKSFITFGAVDSSKATQVETVYLLRRRKLRFRGGLNRILSSSLHVTVDGVLKQQRNFGSNVHDNGDYLLFESSSTFSPVNSATPTLVDYVSFGGGPAGVSVDSVIRITNKQPIYAGTACVDSNSIYVDGAWVPCYGLGQFSDYSAFSFPRVVELLQQRLVFSGFPHNPLFVCLSSVSDSNTPGEYFRFFQQDLFTDKATDPLDFTISSTAADDYVTNLVEYQGSLFVGTSKATYRVSATGRAPLEQGNFFVSTIGATGPLNHRSITKTETSVLLLCERGVFSLENGTNAQEATEYVLKEVSTAIHSIFKEQPDSLRTVGWIDYNPVEDAVLIGVASNKSTLVATRLFRYGVFRDSWSEYTTTGGFNTYGGYTIKSKEDKRKFLYSCARTVVSGVPSNLAFLVHTDKLYLDFIRVLNYVGGQITLNITPVPTTTHTITDDVRYYSVGFDTLPIDDVYDITCTVGQVTLQPFTDFVKVGSKIFLQYGEPGETLTIRYKNLSRSDGKHFVVYADNIEPPLVNGQFSPAIGTVIKYGTTYQSVFSTPPLTWGTLFGNKRVLSWAGLFDNSEVVSRWEVTDVNSTSGQQLVSIVDLVKNKADCSISFVYDSDKQNSSTSSDLYNFSDFLTFDVGSAFDIDLPMQTESEVLVKQSLQGVGYSFRAVVWECSDSYFSLLSYQIDARQKGKRNRHWSE